MAKNTNNDAEAKVAAASTDNQAAATTDEAAAAQAQADAKAAADTEAKAKEADAEESGEFDYVVVSHFRDKNNAEKVYAPGDKVNRFGAERLEDLISRRLVERRAKA